MAGDVKDNARVRVDGKFFRLGEQKFFVKGVTYGPFPENGKGEPFPEPARVKADLDQLTELGANTLRTYHVPPKWLLDLAAERGFRFLIDIPWWNTGCFLDGDGHRENARRAVREAVKAGAGHPAVLAYSLVNEPAPDVVRWHGARAIGEFIDELVAVAKREDPHCLVTFGNYPPTEYLSARRIDFICFNVYLHDEKRFARYLSHLQMLADHKPLIIGELGIDSLREGVATQADLLGREVEAVFRGGLAGLCVFSFTDEWQKDGRLVEDWKFGLVDAERAPKPAFAAVKSAYAAAPYFPLAKAPKVSVVVCTYNGSRTLRVCLRSLQKLNYPDYEVIVVDDGSTDTVPEVAKAFAQVRYIRQDNQGLSVARNTGLAAATGELVAYTDDDCRADEDWLYYLVVDLVESEFQAMGGHNFLPIDDSPVAAVVMASPGGPTHVMLTEREAEHIPGCNMIFRRAALEAIGGFDPVYRKAGDDVDVCWRLQQAGYRIGFNPAGFVWHYRRSTVRAYLKQQAGYGEAESLLLRKHPDYFNDWGGGHWRGRIYSPITWLPFNSPTVYHGLFGEGMFQSIYATAMDWQLARFTSLERHLLVTLPLLLLAHVFGSPLLAVAGGVCVLAWLGVGVYAGVMSDVPQDRERWWSRPLIGALYLLQPIVRGWARYSERFIWDQTPLSSRETLDTLALRSSKRKFDQAAYWSEEVTSRATFLEALLDRLRAGRWLAHPDAGWGNTDLEIMGSRWCQLQLTTASEWHRGGKVLVRCRIDAEWSFLAKVTLAFTVLAAVIVAGMPPAWWWSLFFALPFGVIAWVHQRKRALRRIFSVILDQVAKDQGLKRIRAKDRWTGGKESLESRPEDPPPAPAASERPQETVAARGGRPVERPARETGIDAG
jgi:glycosyltransferase involved in cell wall biosynthesis